MNESELVTGSRKYTRSSDKNLLPLNQRGGNVEVPSILPIGTIVRFLP